MSDINRQAATCLPSEFRRVKVREFLFGLTLLACLSVIGISPAYAQFNCPAPWATAPNVYGMVLLNGGGTGSSSEFTQTVNQHAVAAGEEWHRLRSRSRVEGKRDGETFWQGPGKGHQIDTRQVSHLSLRLVHQVSQSSQASFGSQPGL